MISAITLNHFKCFETVRIPLSTLTVLAGVNAAGKSTVLQALAVLHQTITANDRAHQLLLNGDCVSLGTVQETASQLYPLDEMRLGLAYQEGEQSGECEWTLATLSRQSTSLPITLIAWHPSPGENQTSQSEAQEEWRFLVPMRWLNASSALGHLAESIFGLMYLSADRLGLGPTHSLHTTEQLQLASIGARGEHAVSLLYQWADHAVLDSLCLPDDPPTLQRQVEAWMREFFPGARIATDLVPRINVVTLGLRTSDETDFHRPQNVGYGLIYALPIFIACLSAQPGQLIIIENPESHLHPSGQAQMGRFLARVAAAGIQVIVETHSDHILNGIRLAVHGGVLPPEVVQLHFFGRQQQEGRVSNQIISPHMDRNGRIDYWPDGFFDEWDKSLETLLGPAEG
jgi:predicted ATPase